MDQDVADAITLLNKEIAALKQYNEAQALEVSGLANRLAKIEVAIDKLLNALATILK